MTHRLLSFSLIAFLALPLTAPFFDDMAQARAGHGFSMGSRGTRTWNTPSSTILTPRWSRPMERSLTPQNGPSPTARGFSGSYGNSAGNFGSAATGAAGGAAMMGRQPAFAGPAGIGAGDAYARPSFAARHPFMTGFAGGMLGAGLFGMLSGHGFFGGLHSLLSFIGLMIQVFLVVMLIRLAVSWFRNRQGNAGTANAGPGITGSGGRPMPSSSPSGKTGQPVTLDNTDYQEFQDLLVKIQAAWSARDIQALQRLATPEMAGYFNEQLSELASRGARNTVSDIQFLQGELSEAWREGPISYATVAIRYSMIDVTTDNLGNVIDGSKTERQTVTELWTFLRADGRGNWILSAIQQAG